MHVVLRLRAENRPATEAERQVLQQWTGWGATPYLFDERKKFAATFAAERAHLRDILSEDEYAKARSSTLNAHYTDPAYARVVWQALQQFGVPAGGQLRVLEPGVGAGRFLADAPADAEIVGVEVDPITAAVAQALYPNAQILTESFADTRPPEEDFDVAVGNVPFGKYKLRDPKYNPGRRHSIHNHFILKSLEYTRPGGIVVLITSRYTLDGTDEAREAREQMAAVADLLGAVRLPSNSHQDAAGTNVVMDLLIFRRRGEGETPAGADWLTVEPTVLPGARTGVAPQPIEINNYFVQHPEMVLGTPKADIVRYGPKLVVEGNPQAEAALRTALDQVAQQAQDAGRTFTERMVFHGTLEKYDGLLELGPEGTFTEIRNGRPVPHVPAKTQVRELRELIGLRDIAVALLDEESENHLTTPRMTQLRAELNRRYDAYVTRFGPINRFKVNNRPSADGTPAEEASERRTYPRMGGFRNDPFAPYVFALENFDEDTQTAKKADLFAKRVVAPPEPLKRADSPEDAALICWDQHNEIRLDTVAALLGLDSEQAAREALGTLVYDDPDGGLVRRMEYLSGNVRRKLAAAEQAAAKDPKYAVNVEALSEVIPRDLQPAEIESRLGAAWVSAKYVQQFLREILEDDDVKVSNLGARWSVKGGDTASLLARTVWGTQARSAQALASNLLNNQEILVTKKLPPDGPTVTDTKATAFALAKSRQLDDRFRMWLWEDPDRAETLLRYYNHRYNAIVPPNYTGVQITAPGLSKAYTLHPHQKAAVARIRATKTGVGLYHGTGAGKTLEMIVGGMELTRLGLAKKPVYAVPKGVLGQFQREFLQAYPRARILVADSSDLTGERRHQFVARWSTGNWDAVIISHTAFKKIPMSKVARLDYISQEVKRLEAHLDNADGGDKFTVKDIENQIATLKGRIEDEIKTPGDSGVEFERTGSTYIFYDEAHTLKNLRVISSIRELALEGNQITADMDMKLSYLRKNYGGRVVTQATATPVDNSPMEILTAIKYLAPDLLRDEWGIEEDDQFVSTFIQPVNRVEMSPDGNSFSTRARYARYVNQTELKRVLFSIADVKLKKDLQLGEPAIIGGEMRILEAEASPELRTVMQSLGTRMMGIRLGQPDMKFNRKGKLVEDNTLWISTDGRLASLDVRLVNRSTTEAQKVDVAADELFRLWQLHKDDVFYDEDGNEEPNRGSLQLAFCDLGVPGPDKEFVFYEALREALTARGMPGSLIRFDQEAKNPQQKARLDKDAREGRVAVLVGSRSGLGTGRNLQKRVIHVMQIDPTWKATPIIQSLGRGKRQGNQNTAIHHTAIVTKKSYDPFLWQKVATKQAFAEAILDVNDTSRILEASEDGDDGRIPAGVMFAVAADKPELEQLERVEGRLAKLRLDQQMWHDEQFAYQVTGEQGRRRVQDLKARVQEAAAAMERRTDTRGDAFTMTVEGRTFDERREAGEALAQRLERLARASVATGMQKDAVVGELGGFPVVAVTQRAFDGMYVQLYFREAPVDDVRLTASGLANQDRVGLIRRLENTLDSLESVHTKAQEHIARIETNIERAKELVGKPFPQQAELDKVTAEHRKLTKALGVHGAVEASEPEAHDTEVTEPGAELVDAAVHDAMVLAGGTSDGWVEVDPATITTADLSDTTRGLLDALADGAGTGNGPAAVPASSGTGTPDDISSRKVRGPDLVASGAPYADEVAAVTGEEAVLAAFAAWQDINVVDGMSGRGHQLARQMNEAGIALAEALEQERASAPEESATGGDPWALSLCRELARTSEEFLSFLDSPSFKPNEAGCAMRDHAEQVARTAIEHTRRGAPLADRRHPARRTPADPSPARPSVPTASAHGASGPFDPDRWYQHTMLGGTLSDSRGTFLNDIVQQLGHDGSDVTIEPDPTGTVVITGPIGSVTVTPLTEELPASVAHAYKDAIEQLLQEAQHALRPGGHQAGDLFDDWLSTQLDGPAHNLRASLTDEEETAFRQAMRVRFYETSPWAHPDTADRPQPGAQSRQEAAADEADAPQRSPEHAPEQTSGGAISAPATEPAPATTPHATAERPWRIPNTPYTDRSEYWHAEQAALATYRRWAADHARRLATGEREDALTTAAETAIAASRTGRMARLLGMDSAPEWTHLQHLADQCRAVVEQWEREDGRSTEGNWEVFTGLRDHASRYRSTVEDPSGDAYRRWAGSPEPLTLDEDAVEFIPGILPWDQYTVTGPQGLRAGPVSGRDLAAGLAQLTADGNGVEETQGGLAVSGPDGVQFSVRLAGAQPSTPVPPSTATTTPEPHSAAGAAPSPEPGPATDPEVEVTGSTVSTPLVTSAGATGDGFGSALPQVANLAIVLGGYADAAELVSGRHYVALATEQLRQVLARHDSTDPTPAHQEAAAAASAVIEGEPHTPADVFSLYDHLAETAVQLADDTHHDVRTAAQKANQYAERHLARMQARRADLADLLMDAADLDDDHTAVLDHDDPLRLTAPWYQDRAQVSHALTFIFDDFPKWPHAYDDQGGEHSDQLRGAMLMLHRGHDTVASALTDWMQVTSYALGAAQEAEAAGDGVSRYALRDLARRTFQHHQRLAAHELGMEETPYEGADDFVGGANKAEAAWNWWMASDTAKTLLDSTTAELRETQLSAAREALNAAQDTRYAADFATADDETLDDVNRHVTAMAHAAYDLVLSLDTSDYRHPDDAKRLDDVVRYSYEHAVACRASTARPETVTAVQAGVAQRRQRLDAERGPAPEPRETPPSTGAALDIEHHYRGTVVRGTTNVDADAPVRAALDRHKFRWSPNKKFWYLRRNMSRPTRDLHVRNLTAELTRMGRPYRMVEEPRQETAAEILIPVGEPYASKAEAQQDFWEMYGALSGLKDTPAGRRLIGRGLTDQGVPTRPDGQAVWLAMEELCDGPVGRVRDPFTHPAATVVERCTTLAHAVLLLAQNLKEERYRAPVVMAHFRKMTQYAVQLASRITATAHQGVDWQEIFGTPALTAAQTADELPEPVGPEPAPEADGPRHRDALEDGQNIPSTGEEGADTSSGDAVAQRPEEVPQRRFEITVAARSAAGHLLVNVALPADRTGAAQEVPDLRSADIPGLALPAHTALPLLVRPAKLSDSLVSDEEVEAWLDEHLPDSPVAPAWNSPAVRVVIQRTVRDVLRDSMAPAAEDVADWLVNTARENPGLIQAAHAHEQADFLAVFATAADELITDGGSEHLLWTYLKEDGRREVLNLAGPRAHRELRQQTVEPTPSAPGPSVPDEQPTASPAAKESERERKRAEFQAESSRWATEMRDDARERAVRVALADDQLRALLTDGRSREEARELFMDWLSHADLSATGTGGDRFRDWFGHTRQGVEEQYAKVTFNQVYEAVSAAPAAESVPEGSARQVGLAPPGSVTPSAPGDDAEDGSPRPPASPRTKAGSAESPRQTAGGNPSDMLTGPYLAEEHLNALPRGTQERPVGDARLAVLVTMPFRDGQVHDALLLLQRVEVDEEFGDDPLVHGAQIVPANDQIASSVDGRWTPEQLLSLPDSRVLPLDFPITWPAVEALAALPHEEALEQLRSMQQLLPVQRIEKGARPAQRPEASSRAEVAPGADAEGEHGEPGLSLPVVEDEFSILFAADRDLLRTRETSDGQRDPSVIHLGQTNEQGGVLADTSTVHRLIDEGVLKFDPGMAVVPTAAGRRRLKNVRLADRPLTAVGDRVLNTSTGSVGIVCGYVTSLGIQYAAIVADREGWPQGWSTTAYPQYLTVLEPGAMAPEDAAELYRTVSWGQQPTQNPSATTVPEGAASAQPEMGDTQHLLSAQTEPLTREHLRDLPRYSTRPPIDAEIQFGVVLTLSFATGEMPDAVLLLQAAEEDPRYGDLLHGVLIAPDSELDLSSKTGYTIFPRDLLHRTDARLLPLEEGLTWGQVEELVRLPYVQALGRLPLAAPTEPPAGSTARDTHEPTGPSEPLKDLIGALGDRVAIGHIGQNNRRQEEETPSASAQDSAPASPSSAAADEEQQEDTVTATEPETTAPGPWTSRIKIVSDATGTYVTGTTGAPQEDGLRELLKRDKNFKYEKGRWRYNGMRGQKEQVLEDVRAFLAARDAQEGAVTEVASGKYPPTAQQQAIITAAVEGKDVAVQALAGTGKTSTLVMIAAQMLERRIGYIAFNRAIADEAGQKFGRNVTARTSHSFALQDLRNTPYRQKVSIAGSRNSGARRPKDVAAALGITAEIRVSDRDGNLQHVGPEEIAKIVMGAIRRYRQSADAELGRQHLGEKWAHVPAARTLLEYARRAWADIADPNSNKIFFDHDDYLKIWALSDPRLNFDTIFFDEAQDINPVLKKVIQDQEAQIIVVGDSNQAIYEFRGAIDALKDWPADVVLPLTQSWRFGPAVAEVGNAYLALLESDLRLEGAPTLDTVLGTVEEPDAILTHTNVGAISAVFAGFEASKRVALVGGGRDIEDIAWAARDLQQGRRTKHPELSAFENWSEVKEYAESDEDANTLQMFVRLVDRYTPQGLINMIRDLVPEEARDEETHPELVVSTAHKSKGREWDEVQIWGDFPQPKEDTKTGELVLPAQDKLRLAYVTVTRARKRLDIGSLGWIQSIGLIADTPQAEITAAPTPEQAAPTPAAVAPAVPEPVLHATPPAATETAPPSTVDEPQPTVAETAAEETEAPVPQSAPASAEPSAPAPDDGTENTTEPDTAPAAQTEPRPQEQPATSAPTLHDSGQPLNGADQPSLFTGTADNTPADEQATAPAASQEADAGIAPLPWDDQKIKKRGTAGIRRGQKTEIPNLAREMREALGDNQVRDVWEQDNPWAQFEENLRHAQNLLPESDSTLLALVTEAAEELRTQIAQLAAEAAHAFDTLIQDRADDPDQLAELDAQLGGEHRLPELTDPRVRQALALCLEAVDAIERTARSRRLRPAAARDALEQVMGLAGTSYSPDGQQIWPNVDAALAPVKVEVDRARERIAGLSNSTVTEQYARLRALIAAHEAQPTVEPPALDTPAPAPEARENTSEPPAPAEQEEHTPDPLTDRDIGAALATITPWDLGQLIFEMDQKKRKTPQPLEGIRLPSEPGYNEEDKEFATARARSGAIEIEVRTSDDVMTPVRAGRLTLAKVISWLRPALPPTRRQLVAAAWRTGNAMSRSEEGFKVIGESRRWQAANDEVRNILKDAHARLMTEALEAHLTGTADERLAQVRAAENWAQEEQQLQLIDLGEMEEASVDVAAFERVTALRAVLPDRHSSICHLSEVKPGDCITDVSEERLPFIVRERPVVSADTEVSLIGDLVAGPGDLRPYTWESGGYPDDYVEPLLLPQSLAGLVDLPADAPDPAAVPTPAVAAPAAVPTALDTAPEAAPSATRPATTEPDAAPGPEEVSDAPEQQSEGPEAAEATDPAPVAGPGHLPYERQQDFLDDLYATESRYAAWADSATGRLLLSEARELQEETGVTDANEAARVQTAFRGVIRSADSAHSAADEVLAACRDLHMTVAEAGRSLATRTAFVSADDRLLLLAVYSQAQEQLARLEATENVQTLLDNEHDGARLFSRFKATRAAENPSAAKTPEPAPAQEPRVAEPQTAAPVSLPPADTADESAEPAPESLESDVPGVEIVELPEVLEESTPEPAPAAGAEQAVAGPAPSEPTAEDDFDFWRDVIGDDLVVNGVVYSSSEWEPDPEDGVRRRTEEDDEPVSAQELAAMELDQEYEALIKEEHMAATEAVQGQPEVAQPEPGQDDFDRHFEDIVALLRGTEPPAEEQAPIPRPRFSAEDEQHLREQYAATRQALSGILTSIDADPILPAAEDAAVEAGDAAALEAAMGNAQAEAGYYWGTPEWTMIRSISQAGQQLSGSVREALLTYAETTLGDIRAHGINRTIEARTARAIAQGAMLLARRLERSGQRDSRGWRAVWGLHRAAATRADRLTGLLPASQQTDLADQLSRAWQWFSERLSARSQDTGNSTGGDDQGRIRTMLSNSVESIGRLYGAVSERLGNLAQHPVWRRIASVWTAVREAVHRGWLGVGRFLADRQTLGTGRALWVRTLEIISSGAQALINRLAANGGRNGLRWNLLRVLRHAAEDHVAHLHGHLPEDVSTPLGTYESVVDEAAEQAPAEAEGTAPQAPSPEGPSAEGAESAPGDENPVENPDLFRAVVLQVAAKEYTLALDLSYDYGVSAAEADTLLARMEELGVVGPQGDGGVREVLVAPGEAESLLDATPASDRPAPRWQPVSEPLTPAWFDEVRTAIRSDVQPDRGLSRRDLMSLLNHENTRPGNRADAGRRANECVDLFLQGRGAEIPQHLAGEGFAYVRGTFHRDWALHEDASPTASPAAASGQAEAAGEQEAVAGPGLPRRRRPTPTDGPSRIERAAAGPRRQPAPTAGQNPAVTAGAVAVQAQRIQDRADFARAAATSPAEERAAGVLQTIAAHSRATADRIAGAAPAGGPSASPQPALTAEAFLAALRTTAQARGAQIPDDLLASAMEAAQEAVAAAPQSSAGSAAAVPRPTRRGQAAREQAEHRLPGQHNAPSGVGRR
ncbi:UvrD-helicase domain-containing protein [Streptomyces sp. NPDC048420]|uniref:UvrD-helicase domain-containing protein n=1 Tax=Streptomyces sp. NPDC048420 TaxID=3155755 RepID=UPI003443495E